MAFVWLGETITLFEFVAMCCCFGGIVIVALGGEDETEVIETPEVAVVEA